MLGGTLWAAWAISHALQPIGCVAEECNLAGRSMREGSSLGSVLQVGAAVALAAGIFGLVSYVRSVGRFGRIGSLGLVASAAGIVTVIAASLVQSLVYNNDFWAMPYFVIPAALALVIGCVLLGVAILRSGVLPRWVAALLIIGTLAMLGMNEQNTLVLMAIPFGVAWAVIGYILWSQRGGMRTTARIAG